METTIDIIAELEALNPQLGAVIGETELLENQIERQALLYEACEASVDTQPRCRMESALVPGEDFAIYQVKELSPLTEEDRQRRIDAVMKAMMS